LDALETYGPEDDANIASFVDDAESDTSVWEYDITKTPPYKGWIEHDKIVAAVNALGPTVVNESNIELDALMACQDQDTIIFSIVATFDEDGDTLWHGGELIVMDVNDPEGADWLNHGGHDWDHDFLPDTAFAGVNTNEVDAIEAWDGHLPGNPGVPTLTNWGLIVLLALLILSGIYVIYQRRKGVARA
jgi:hypothetical protein